MSTTSNFNTVRVLSKSEFENNFSSTNDDTLYFVEYTEPVHVTSQGSITSQTAGTITLYTYRYRTWSDGTVEQWFIYPSTTATSATVTLPISYSDTDYVVTSAEGGGKESEKDTEGVDYCLYISNQTTTTFRISKVKNRRMSFYIVGYNSSYKE